MDETVEKIKVGYLGPDEVTFGYMAAQKFFISQAAKVQFVPYISHQKVIFAKVQREVDYGVVAVENAIDGIVTETVRSAERLAGLGMHICGEVAIPINHYLLSKSGDESSIKKIMSHESALRQCQKVIAEFQEKGISIEVTGSTGEGAKQAADSDGSIAAISTETAQSSYVLKRVRPKSIADYEKTVTRFWILGDKFSRRSGDDKTCILLNLERDAPGVLYQAIGFFAKQNISLAIIFPCPIPKRDWEYTFLLEIQGHIEDKEVRNAYYELLNSGLTLGAPIVLGSYPNTTIVSKAKS